jgi:hypothetical protein
MINMKCKILFSMKSPTFDNFEYTITTIDEAQLTCTIIQRYIQTLISTENNIIV